MAVQENKIAWFQGNWPPVVVVICLLFCLSGSLLSVSKFKGLGKALADFFGKGMVSRGRRFNVVLGARWFPWSAQLSTITQEGRRVACHNTLCSAESKGNFGDVRVPLPVVCAVGPEAFLNCTVMAFYHLSSGAVRHGMTVFYAPLLQEALPKRTDKWAPVVARNCYWYSMPTEDLPHTINNVLAGSCS